MAKIPIDYTEIVISMFNLVESKNTEYKLVRSRYYVLWISNIGNNLFIFSRNTIRML